VVDAVGSAPGEPSVTAHRDFHAAQLLIHDGRLRLVDVDTVGTGTRADDLAMLLAQLTCLARPGAAQSAVELYRGMATARFQGVVDPVSLRLRTAAALLGFALGPFRVQEPRWPQETMRRIAAAADLARG
jgi:aminoglycoside phosphotransferase (APT) family kinase protein